jgi:ketosteroid isomerase-like protein
VDPDNRQLAIAVYEAQRRRDNSAIFAIYDPQIEWDISQYPYWLEQSLYHGHEGVRQFMREWLGSFERWEPEVEDAVAAGDRVLLVIFDRCWAHGSAAPIERRYGHLLDFRDGRVVRSEIHADLETARAELER